MGRSVPMEGEPTGLLHRSAEEATSKQLPSLKLLALRLRGGPPQLQPMNAAAMVERTAYVTSETRAIKRMRGKLSIMCSRVDPLNSRVTSGTDGRKRDTKLANYIEVGMTWSSGH